LIKIFPEIDFRPLCPSCSKVLEYSHALVWQGVHICTENFCGSCNEKFLCDLPIGQAQLEKYQLRKSDGEIFGSYPHEWLVSPLKKIIESPIQDKIKIEIETREPAKSKVIILNTLDNCYGHSLLYLLNLQNIIKKKADKSVIVIIQPFLKWLLPAEGIAEVWTVYLSLTQMREYYSDLTTKINEQILRFDEVYLSQALLCPKDIDIKKFTKISPYSFENTSKSIRVTFIWRQDTNRFWIKSYWIYGGLRKLGIASVILPFHYLRVLFFLYLLRWKLNDKSYQITLAGFGKFGWFPSFVDDKRVILFNKESEIDTCVTYSESELVIGVHGSSMILPSCHAGMTISVMPLKRWGNFIEDILYSEDDLRLAAFQKRVIPMNTTILETVEIALAMIKGRAYFVKKFIYDKEVL